MKATFIDRFPCIINGASVAVTTLASGTVLFHLIQGVLGLVILITSAGTSFFTCLIAFRRWYRGFKIEQHRKKLP
jgi:uncharacterized membrane protein YidH (DUF202 family)